MKPTKRPKISVFIAMSLDGYIAKKDGDVSWLHNLGAPSGEDCGYNEFYQSVDALVMGRKSYEKVITFPDWPYPNKRVIVLSNTLKKTLHNAEIFQGDINQLVRNLCAEGINHIYIDGGVTVSKFLDAKLVDQMTLSIIPVILGEGISLFKQINTELAFKLISSKFYPFGLVQSVYEFIK